MFTSRHAFPALPFRLAALVGALALAGLAAACGSKPAGPAAPSATAWAVVDGREISGDDVEKAYRRTLQGQAPPSDEEVLNAKLGVLNELIVQDILLAKARALKIEVSSLNCRV